MVASPEMCPYPYCPPPADRPSPTLSAPPPVNQYLSQPPIYYPNPIPPPPPSSPPPAPPDRTKAILTGSSAAAKKVEKIYVLEVKVVKVRPDGKESCQTHPRVTFEESSPAVVHVGSILGLKEGSVADLMTPAASVPPADQVKMGSMFRVTVKALEKDRVRVDLCLQRHEVETASRTGIIVQGHTLRAVQQAQLGKWVKLTLNKDGAGATRIEFKVSAGQ
jgi:hypothetical protein